MFEKSNVHEENVQKIVILIAKCPKKGEFQEIFFFAFFASFSLRRIFFAENAKKFFFASKSPRHSLHCNSSNIAVCIAILQTQLCLHCNSSNSPVANCKNGSLICQNFASIVLNQLSLHCNSSNSTGFALKFFKHCCLHCNSSNSAVFALQFFKLSCS